VKRLLLAVTIVVVLTGCDSEPSAAESCERAMREAVERVVDQSLAVEDLPSNLRECRGVPRGQQAEIARRIVREQADRIMKDFEKQVDRELGRLPGPAEP